MMKLKQHLPRKIKAMNLARCCHRIGKAETGGGAPSFPSKPPQISPHLKQVKTKVLQQSRCLEFSSQISSKTHADQAIKALKEKSLHPNERHDNLKNPFNRP